MSTTAPTRTLLPGETLNLTTDPEFSGEDLVIRWIHPDGFASKCSARTRTNVTDSNKRDRSSTGVFVAGDDAKTLSMPGSVLGAFDIVYCASTSDPIRCELVSRL